jgi:hypothetical protein
VTNSYEESEIIYEESASEDEVAVVAYETMSLV